MKHKKTLWIAVAVAAVLVLALVIWLCTRPGEAATTPDTPTESTTPNADPDVESPDPDALSATVGNGDTSNVTTDTAAGTPWKTMADSDYSVGIRSLGGYDGLFVEDGSDDSVTNVLALQFTNNGSTVIQYAEYAFDAGGETLVFKLSDLPAGESVVVLEANRHAYDSAAVLELTDRVVATVDELTFASDQVLIVDNGDSSLTLMNLTDETLPVVRVFYKYYYEEERTFVGGITYTAKGRSIPAGGSVTIYPSHYVTDGCVLMGSAIYSE